MLRFPGAAIAEVPVGVVSPQHHRDRRARVRDCIDQPGRAEATDDAMHDLRLEQRDRVAGEGSAEIHQS
jgi:hypothetical protein